MTLIALVLLITVIRLLGIRWRSIKDHPFPTKPFPCQSCPYFQHAQSEPEHALTVCPECGLTLLPKELAL